jgi:hypothetical protein
MKTPIGRKDGTAGRKRVTMRPFDVQEFLDSAGVARKIVQYRRLQKIYAQGEPATKVMYIQKGSWQGGGHRASRAGRLLRGRLLGGFAVPDGDGDRDGNGCCTRHRKE